MNGFKILFFVILAALAIGYAASQGWLGGTEEPTHCTVDTAGQHHCE